MRFRLIFLPENAAIFSAASFNTTGCNVFTGATLLEDRFYLKVPPIETNIMQLFKID